MRRFRTQAPLLAVVCATSFACGGDGGTATSDPSTTTGTSGSESTSTAAPETSTGEPQESSSESNPETSAADSSSSDDGPNEGGGAVCNNGIIEGNEDCDCGEFTCSAEGLDNKLCSDVDDPLAPGPLTGGVLGCNPTSCRFDTSMCSWCGDEFIGEHEDCEPETPIDVGCSDLGKGAAGSVTCGTSCTYDVSGCTTCGARFEFQASNCPHGFTVSKLDPDGAGVSWQCGDPTNYAGGPGDDVTGTFATNLGGDYNPNEISALTSPAIDLSTCAAGELELELTHWHDFEGGDDNSDGGILQVSTDGTVWTTIAPSSGTLYTATPIDATYPPVQGVVGFSGEADAAEWVSSVFDLSDFEGEDSLQIRLVIGSDENVQRGGWYIDTLEVRGSDS